MSPLTAKRMILRDFDIDRILLRGNFTDTWPKQHIWANAAGSVASRAFRSLTKYRKYSPEIAHGKKKPWVTGLELKIIALKLFRGACARHFDIDVAVFGAAGRGRVIGDRLAFTQGGDIDIAGVNALADQVGLDGLGAAV